MPVIFYLNNRFFLHNLTLIASVVGVGTLKDGYVRKVPLLQGCVPGLTPKDGYVRKVPILQAPRIQHASHVTNMTQDTCYLAQVPRIPTWSDLTGSLAGLGRRALLPFSLVLM